MKNSETNEKLLDFWGKLPRFLCVALISLVATFSFAQVRDISGIVVDQIGEPIIGANVLVEGTMNGTITDIDGNFSLLSVDDNAKLQISFIGYIAQSINVAGKSSFRIVLAEDSKALDEVIVIGYGTAKRSDVTGALTRVTDKQIQERPVQNALQAMQGKAAGVDITGANRPGEVGEIRIRGNRSINASNEPLYVIDGIPMISGNTSADTPISGNMADINPNDIASIEILKDASATAIYGSRGANGVILITTKQGQSGKVSVNYDGSQTFTRIHSLTNWMGSGELLDWERSAYLNAGTYGGRYGNAPDPERDFALFMDSQSYMQRILRTAYEYNADGSIKLRAATDAERAMGYADQVPVYNADNLFDQNWTDLVTRTGITSNHQLSLSAGTDKAKIYISAAYLNQKSPSVDQSYERYTAFINGEVTPSTWLKLGMSMNASHAIQDYGMIYNGNSNTGNKDSYSQALGLLPYAPAYDEDGNILNTNRLGPSADNVLLNIKEGVNENRNYGFFNSSFAEISFTPWLKYRVNFGAQFRSQRNGNYHGPDYTNPIGSKPVASEANVGYYNQRTDFSWVVENLVFFNKTFAEKHSVGATLLQSAQKSRYETINIRAREITFPSSLWYALDQNGEGTAYGYGTSLSETAMASYMGRLNYTLMDRYLVTLTGRWDGASVLAPGNKWDFFPSMALAWKMEEENFLRDVNWLDQLKIRAGYGVTGNSAVGAYSTTGTIRSRGVVFGSKDGYTTGYKSNLMPNYDLGWEKTAQTNVGIDFSFLRNRIFGSIEYYVANTSDLLMDKSIPSIVGYSKVQANVGKTQNKGFELTLSTVNINKRDFRWQTDFSFSTNKEKIVELAGGKQDDLANEWFIGQPIHVYRDWKYDRIWTNSAEDIRLMQIYKAFGGITAEAGQVKVVDQQPMIEVEPNTPGAISATLDSGEVVWLMDNGFGKIDDDDKVILGNPRPKWVGGITNTFNYKNWELNFYIYIRAGSMYPGAMQTYGRRVEKDIWSETNQNASYPRPTQSSITSYNRSRTYASGTMVAVRNIALSYNVPPAFLSKYKINSASVYAQVLNPFMFGGEIVKLGINPDDTTGWGKYKDSNGNYLQGQSNNTSIYRSFVVGLRLGF